MSEAGSEEIRPQTARWVGITGAAQVWKFAISLTSTVILGRLLVPADFGLVATIGPLVAFADLLRDLGFTQAVVQRREISMGEVNALFWLSVLITIVLATLLSLASPAVAALFHEPRLTSLLIVAAWTLVLGSFSALPLAWLNRQLRFSVIAGIEMVASAMSLTAAATCAWLTHSYWALMIASVGYTLSAAVLSQWASGWRPGRPAFGPSVMEMAKFGAGVSTANIFNFLARNADNLLIAMADGPALLGLYDRAYKLMLLPLTQVTWPVSRVLAPVLTRQRDDPARYRATYFNAVGYMMLATQPGLIVAVLYAEPVIKILLGPRWDGVAPIFAWLGFAAIQQLASSSFGWLFLSQGRARDLALSSLVGSAIAVTSFLVGLPHGPLGVAAAYAAADWSLRLPFALWLVGHRGPIGVKALLETAVLPHAAASTAAALTAWGAGAVVRTHALPFFVLAVPLSYAAYLGVLSIWPSKRRLVGSALSQATRILRARAPRAGRWA